MKFIKAMYVVMGLMLFVNLTNVTIFQNNYAGISLWICLILFILGTAFFINARQIHSKRNE